MKIQLANGSAVEILDSEAKALMAAVHTDEGPYEQLRRQRILRYGQHALNPWRVDANGTDAAGQNGVSAARPVARLEDGYFYRQIVQPFFKTQGRTDADAFARELEFISATLYTTQTPEFTSFAELPLAMEQPSPWKTSHSWGELDGKSIVPARAYVDTLPRPTINRSKNTTSLLPCVGAYGWDAAEMGAAMLGNVPLSMVSAYYAKYGFNQTQNEENYFGNAAANIPGFFTASGINSSAVLNGGAGTPQWSTKTAKEILADLNAALRDYNVAVRGGRTEAALNRVDLLPDVMFMPMAPYNIIALTPYSDINPDSILTVFLRNAQSVAPGFKVVMIPEMAGRFTASSDALCVTRRDPMIAGRVVALPLAELPPQYRAFSTTVPIHSQAGGCVVFKPLGILIRTKIG
ncbi:MAG: major capsid family protein [Terriglobales bacterium]